MKSLKIKDNEIEVIPTYKLKEAADISDFSENDELVLDMLDKINEKYNTYNPSIMQIKTQSTMANFYGDKTKFFHYNKQ